MDASRYQRAVEHDIEIVTSFGDDSYRINGDRDIDYLVNMEQLSCTCPDWQKHKQEPSFVCKHLIKVNITDGIEDSVPVAGTPSDTTKQSSTSHESASGYPDDWELRRQGVFERDDWTCQSCDVESGPTAGVELHAHHIEPIADGGSDELENLLTLCKDCHRKLHGHIATTSPSVDDASTPGTSGIDPGMDADSKSLSETIYIPPEEPYTVDTKNTTNSTDQIAESSHVADDAKLSQITEPATPAADSAAEEIDTSDALIGGLLLAGLAWLILEAILYLLGWTPGTGVTRFLAILVPLELLLLLGSDETPQH